MLKNTLLLGSLLSETWEIAIHRLHYVEIFIAESLVKPVVTKNVGICCLFGLLKDLLQPLVVDHLSVHWLPNCRCR